MIRPFVKQARRVYHLLKDPLAGCGYRIRLLDFLKNFGLIFYSAVSMLHALGSGLSIPSVAAGYAFEERLQTVPFLCITECNSHSRDLFDYTWAIIVNLVGCSMSASRGR